MMVKARKIMEVPQPAWEMCMRAFTMASSKIGLCGWFPPNENPINWRPGPHTPKAWPPPTAIPIPDTRARSLGISGIAGMVGEGHCYQQQGEEGQVVTAADRPADSDLCGAALGRPVS